MKIVALREPGLEEADEGEDDIPPLSVDSESDSDEPDGVPKGTSVLQPEVADGRVEPVTHRLYRPLVELPRTPEILGLHVVRQIGREKQLHVKVRVSTGGRELVLGVLVDTAGEVSLVKTGLLPRESLRPSQRPVRLKVATGQYMSGGTREAMLILDFIHHEEFNRPDLGQPISLEGLFYEANM